MHQHNKMDSLLPLGLMAALLIAVTLASPVAAATLTQSQDTEIDISCDVPGQIVEAGETATFDITVTNNGQEVNRHMWTEMFETGKYDWEVRFLDGTKEINILALPKGGTIRLTVEVETDSYTPEGKYGVRIHIGDGFYWLYTTISQTHAGEKGTLELTVVDKDGEKIKGASVSVLDPDDLSGVDQLMTTAGGTVSAQLDQGIYQITIGKDGYTSVDKKDVKIKGGITTDIGTILLDKALYAAEVTVQSSILTTTASSNPVYTMTIKNIGKSDDTYRLSVEGSPEWYFRFQDGSTQSVDLSELFLKSGEEKTLTLEAVIPYGVEPGDYNFTMLVDSSQETYTENLTAKIRGDYDLKVYAEQYQYEVNKGESLSFDLILMNGGTAGALTNVKVSVSAPTGWTADVAPETISGIPPGTQKTVTLTVVPPSNIAASEYKITVSAASDQTKLSDDFRIVVHEQSYIGILGILLLIGIGTGIVFVFRKYSRR